MRTMVFTLIFGLLAAFSSTNSRADTLSLTDVDNNKVEVSFAEVKKAYFGSFPGAETNLQIENGDGSVSILKPTFKYAGKEIFFKGQNEGICKYFGFDKEHGSENIHNVQGPMVLASMKNDGTLDSIHHYRSENFYGVVTSVVVCSR